MTHTKVPSQKIRSKVSSDAADEPYLGLGLELHHEFPCDRIHVAHGYGHRHFLGKNA